MSVIQGGKFGHGFVSAGLTKAATPRILSFDNVVAESVASAVVGGTASEITGGKFANGAATGALMYAANACSSGGCWKSLKTWFAQTFEDTKLYGKFVGRAVATNPDDPRVGAAVEYQAGARFDGDIQTDTNGLVTGLDSEVTAEARIAMNRGYGYSIGRGGEVGIIRVPNEVYDKSFAVNVDTPIGGLTVNLHPDYTLPVAIGFGGPSIGASISFDDPYSGLPRLGYQDQLVEFRE